MRQELEFFRAIDIHFQWKSLKKASWTVSSGEKIVFQFLSPDRFIIRKKKKRKKNKQTNKQKIK